MKIKILDTNVFIYDPNALFKYPKELVIIPISVIEELDKLKKDQTEVGRNARTVTKKLDKLRKKSALGSISQIEDAEGKLLPSPGIKLKNEGFVAIELNHSRMIEEFNLDPSVVDNRILSVAYDFNKRNKDVQLITKDANLRIKAGAFKLPAEDYESDMEISNFEADFKGHSVKKVSGSQLDSLVKDRSLILPDVSFKPNEYAFLVDESDEEGEIFRETCRFDQEKNKLVPISKKNAIFGISPRNPQQAVAIDALLNPDIHLVTISGHAGTGKTLIAVAAALQLVLEDRKFERILISRPVFPLGKDIGYLPGDIGEKMNPWMQPIFDNLELLFHGRSRTQVSAYQNLIEQKVIQVEPLTYIRGRSIPNQIFILDESQNLSKHEVKTILSRMGEGAKIILTGDPEQIDNPYVDKYSNGLSQVIEKFKDNPLAAHIQLEKGERSKLAQAVVDIFK